MSKVLSRFLWMVAVSIATLPFASCEEIVDAEGLPYDEKLVIHSIIYADSAYNYVRISRTLPVNVPFDTNQAYIRDAVGSITDGSQSFPLEYAGARGTYRVVGLRPVPGKSYNLTVSWKDLTARASTSIPIGVSIDSVYIAQDTVEENLRRISIMTVSTLPSPYSGSFEAFVLGDDDWALGSWSNRLHDYRDAEKDGKVYVRETIYESRGSDKIDKVFAFAYFMAPGYKEYFETSSGHTDDFGNPVPVRWNVEGDAIGIFFGCTKIEKVQEY